MLVEHVDDEIDKFTEKRKLAENIAKEIQKQSKVIPQKQEASIFRGKEGIRMYHKEIIKQGKGYSVFGAPKESVKIMGNCVSLNLTLNLCLINVNIQKIIT